MRITNFFVAAVLAVVALPACEKKEKTEEKTISEKISEKIDDALDSRSAEKIRDAAKEIGDGAKKAAKDLSDAVKKAADEMKEDSQPSDSPPPAGN